MNKEVLFYVQWCAYECYNKREMQQKGHGNEIDIGFCNDCCSLLEHASSREIYNKQMEKCFEKLKFR